MTTYRIKKFGRGKGAHVFYMVTEDNKPVIGTKCDFYRFAKRVLNKVKLYHNVKYKHLTDQ